MLFAVLYDIINYYYYYYLTRSPFESIAAKWTKCSLKLAPNTPTPNPCLCTILQREIKLTLLANNLNVKKKLEQPSVKCIDSGTNVTFHFMYIHVCNIVVLIGKLKTLQMNKVFVIYKIFGIYFIKCTLHHPTCILR